MSDSDVALTSRPKKTRSPAYPAIDLATALKRADVFFQHERRNPAPFSVAVQHWGTTEKSSTALLTAAAMKAFGLMAEGDGTPDRRLQLTELALRILLDKRPDSTERAEAIKRAALMPRMHQILWDKYGNELPSDANIEHELVWEWKFNENSVTDFLKEYKATVAFAKLGESDKLSGAGSDNREKVEQLATVGDYVQWESAGVLQFTAPRRVREISDDAEWAFVEGSNTGVPIQELQVITDPIKESEPAATNSLADSRPRPRTMVEAQLAASQALQSPAGIRQDVFSLAEGPVTIQWPASLSPESYQDLGDWLDIVKRKIGRSVKAAGVDVQ
jgi:hypothetical protein